MITSTNNKSGGDGLTPMQQELLAHFNSMAESAQRFMVDMAANNARVFPRQRPKLRVVAGGAA